MSRNGEVASRLEEFADLLEADGVEYKPNVYRRAAENIREHTHPIEELAADSEPAVESIDGVGDAISGKIVEYLETGEIEELASLREELPVDIRALTRVEGVGPKTVGTLYKTLGITTLDELAAAAEAERIQEVKGFGAKTEANIRENVVFAREVQGRERLGDARPLAEAALAYLAGLDVVEAAEVAGSIRRWRDTTGDVDILAASKAGERVVDAFIEWPSATATIEAGESKASVRVEGIRVDLRVVVPAEFGAALQYFTGSKDHNVALRNRAIARDLKMNEYGVFDVSEVADPDAGQRVGERIAGETEASMYGALDLPLVPPELREGTGEIEAAAADELPNLVVEDELRGDLHTHTEWSDGRDSIVEMASAAAARGDDYYAVTDHATGPGMVGGVGLTDAELRDQMAAVDDARDELNADITLLHGVETNIDAEGDLSTAADLLADLDVVVASPHAALGQDREPATQRLVRAVEHPRVDILGHPTGRLITEREGLNPDIERVAAAAADAGTALEINADPARLDLRGELVRVAVDAGATVVVDTDAHAPDSLAYRRYGVHTARRGWCAAGDLLNTRDADRLRSFLH